MIIKNTTYQNVKLRQYLKGTLFSNTYTTKKERLKVYELMKLQKNSKKTYIESKNNTEQKLMK